MKIKLKTTEIRKFLNINRPNFPKYTATFINNVNRNAHGTRPEVVGQLSELIKQFKGQTISEWEDCYLKRYPDAIQKAAKKISDKLSEMIKPISIIDESLIEQWVRDLVILKTFEGLRFQPAIIKKGAEIKKVSYRLATTEEEAKGIDGFIGDIPVSVKPISYKVKANLIENIQAKIIYYEKKKDGIEVDYGEILD
jgi:hypothetical protein